MTLPDSDPSREVFSAPLEEFSALRPMMAGTPAPELRAPPAAITAPTVDTREPAFPGVLSRAALQPDVRSGGPELGVEEEGIELVERASDDDDDDDGGGDVEGAEV